MYLTISLGRLNLFAMVAAKTTVDVTIPFNHDVWCRSAKWVVRDKYGELSQANLGIATLLKGTGISI